MKKTYPKSRSCCMCPFDNFPVDCKKCGIACRKDFNLMHQLTAKTLTIEILKEHKLLLDKY